MTRKIDRSAADIQTVTNGMEPMQPVLGDDERVPPIQMVLIDWVDSGGIDGRVWEFKDEIDPKPHLIQTVGFLVEKRKDIVVVAQSENKDQWGRTFVIPTGCIKLIRELGTI